MADLKRHPILPYSIPFDFTAVLKERRAQGKVQRQGSNTNSMSFENKPKYKNKLKNKRKQNKTSSYLMAPSSPSFPWGRKLRGKLILKYNLRHDLPWIKCLIHRNESLMVEYQVYGTWVKLFGTSFTSLLLLRAIQTHLYYKTSFTHTRISHPTYKPTKPSVPSPGLFGNHLFPFSSLSQPPTPASAKFHFLPLLWQSLWSVICQ